MYEIPFLSSVCHVSTSLDFVLWFEPLDLFPFTLTAEKLHVWTYSFEAVD